MSIIYKLLRLFGLYGNPYHIPNGQYCYKHTRTIDDGFVRINTLCKYYKWKNSLEGHCEYCGRDVIDRVKECGLFDCIESEDVC